MVLMAPCLQDSFFLCNGACNAIDSRNKVKKGDEGICASFRRCVCWSCVVYWLRPIASLAEETTSILMERLYGVADMSPEDTEEVARIMTENREEAGERVGQQHSEMHKQNSIAIDQAENYVEELKKSMSPIPGGLPPSIPEINSGLDELLFEGDIIMTPEQAESYFRVPEEGRRSKRQAFQDKENFPKTLWSQGVFYTFNATLNKKGQDAVDAAVAFWQANTCINFTKTDDPDKAPVKPVLHFYPGDIHVCASFIGRMFALNVQGVSIGAGCERFETTTHEIAHALGFIHEHNRWDRDEYVLVYTDKVNANNSYDYKKVDKNENENYDKGYDFGSIMHYRESSFAAKKGDIVMVARNPDYKKSIGGAMTPVYGDVYRMNMLYSCYDRCRYSGTLCKNEGMPHPKDCKVCQCPSGFGGDDCSQRQAPSHGLTCGETLVAGAEWKTLESSNVVGSGNGHADQGNRSDPHHCTWHVTAPEGKVIEHYVSFVGMRNQKDDILCHDVCKYGGLKIKGHEKSRIPEGMKLCCLDQLKKVRTTVSNVLIIEAYNSWYYTDFTIQYKMLDAYDIASALPGTTTQFNCKNEIDGVYPDGTCLPYFVYCSNEVAILHSCPANLVYAGNQCVWPDECKK
uniref:Metalloendopeptidase n=1 Tax=Steinernema glaseri TaxID=37863 RepID=A0A1I7ZL80_9BILA